MSNVISREVVEELRRHKAGQAPKPKLRRESVTFKPNSEDEISRLVAALVMAIQECPARGHRLEPLKRKLRPRLEALLRVAAPS
jgi:hypothetical protein